MLACILTCGLSCGLSCRYAILFTDRKKLPGSGRSASTGGLLPLAHKIPRKKTARYARVTDSSSPGAELIQAQCPKGDASANTHITSRAKLTKLNVNNAEFKFV
jgi:hypothetical protein